MGKLASGSQLKVLGGPLGAIVGGYSDSDWLYEEVFWKKPEKALEDAFALLRLNGREDGDWSGLTTEEFIRAFSGEARPTPKHQGFQLQTLAPSVGFVLDDVTLARELELSAE